MTTKISWNQYNRMPHDTFYWKGIDGSCVLTHFITTPTPDSQPGSWFVPSSGSSFCYRHDLYKYPGDIPNIILHPFAVKEEEKTYTIINTNSFAIGGVVLLPDIEAKVAYSSEKTPLMVQQTDEGLLIGLDSVPPMGCVKVTVENTVENLESSTGHIFQVEDKKILTPYYIVVYNEYGQISRLYDRRADREVIPNGQRANVLQIFEDKPSSQLVFQ